jgi:Zn-dependent protease/CBS domain-containing protein
MDGSFQVMRLAGIPVRLHYTWLLAVGLVAWSLASGFFPGRYPGWEPLQYWAVGAAAAVLLFVSVLVHELSHAVVARARGFGVRGITLFVFGGVAEVEGEAERPLDEFLIAIVGPITSFAIAGLAWLLAGAIPDRTGMAHAIAYYLAFGNLILGAFNLVPGFPLDGGRVLRAIVWALSGSLRTATNIASYTGQAIALGLVAVGVWSMVNGDLYGGLWTAAIGWFLNGAAEQTRRGVAAQQSFRGVRVADLMTPDPPFLAPDTPLDAFVHEHVIRRARRALPVADGSKLVGIVSVADAQKVPADAWPATPISAVMTGSDLAVVSPADPASKALEAMAARELHQLLVVDRGVLVGLITRAGLLQYLALREQLGMPRRAAPAPRTAAARRLDEAA